VIAGARSCVIAEASSRYIDEFDDAQNPMRAKIAAVTKRLQAVITTDAGGDLLDW
jgi:hypothetical protein